MCGGTETHSFRQFCEESHRETPETNSYLKQCCHKEKPLTTSLLSKEKSTTNPFFLPCANGTLSSAPSTVVFTALKQEKYCCCSCTFSDGLMPDNDQHHCLNHNTFTSITAPGNIFCFTKPCKRKGT